MPSLLGRTNLVKLAMTRKNAVWLLVSVAVTLISVLWGWGNADLKRLNKQHENARQRYLAAKNMARKGFSARAGWHEYNGWVAAPSLASTLLREMARLPSQMEYGALEIHRDFGVLTLDQDAGSEWEFQALQVSGDLTVEVMDAGDGAGLEAYPKVLDRLRFALQVPLKLHQNPKYRMDDPGVLDETFGKHWWFRGSLEPVTLWQGDEK